ncbi:conserved Plasmodium protein, unknown function [Plasmodium knowlesi strain H]|uniref:Uncharacterized protein n=3 Tax=Plasmodium knowlesi TaxID=5850 RepID=A0A5K1V7D2_PLAKH|nr:heptatricopeptide repeat-containing protein, putative [Plasmodium knowlesi strain H]OTN63830.1 Uncharacterized protein PKNOH_S140233700 [Plasmodium knowlesi]CAA9990759.1 heptatricopeptide repeat-containing protein, putative [Plasmodium knowlesi strain H]SBO21136.1 conserved Plasmodium protein, unknown function [Plasmodium knowlesi strain H]SBO21603.1 conserved Plasmodium protein, unknown function [Plasmodium knowlesi strain H]VVS80233.1 heptatricopeptide repeat-containing protein, putative |eukprot:XP_002262048.1 hypothetical protein, conserved in Plasmodium species [Plasmodium knowlesi strain H]
MYLLKKRLELNHAGRISSVALLRNPPRRAIKIRVKNFAYARSIYDCSTLQGDENYTDTSQGVNLKKTLASKFLPPGKDASSKYNENLRSIFFSNTMDDVKDYFDNNSNEMKNHEYVYLLFKMYEIIFSNFYKTYESCDILRLDNPQFRFVTLNQYVDDWVGRYGRSSRKRDIGTVGENEIIFYENDEHDGISDNIFENEGINLPSHSSHKEVKEHNIREYSERLEETKGEMHQVEEHNCVVDTPYLDGDTNHTARSYYTPQFNLNTLMEIHLSYVQYIEKLNIRESTWKDYVSSFMAKKYEELYANVLNVIYKKIFFFSYKDIINYLYITKRINLQSIEEVSMLAENVISQNIKYLDEDALVKVAYIYLNNSNKEKNIHQIGRYGSKDFLETYLSLIQIKVKSMNNENFVKILEYVNSNNYKHVQIFRDLKNEVYKRYNNLTEEQIVKLFFLYSKNMNAADDVLMRNFLKSIVDIFSHEEGEEEKGAVAKGVSCQGGPGVDKVFQLDDEGNGERKPTIGIPLSILLNGIWTSAKYFKDYPFLLIKSERIILENIKNFSASTVSMLIWAYSTVEGKNPQVRFSNELYFELKERALELYQNMTPKQLSNSLLGLSITVGRTVSWDGKVDTEMHEVVERYLLNMGGTKKGDNNIGNEPRIRLPERTFLNLCTSEDLSNLCYAYSLVRSGNRELHSLIQSAIMKKQSDLSPQEIAKIAYAYGNMYFYSSYTLLSSLQYEILQRMHQFCHHEICDILWCYCINRFLDANFWKCMLRVIDMEKLGDSRCCLLYSSLSYVNLIDPSILDSYNTLRIFHLVSENYWQFQIAEYLHSFADDVVDAMYKENTLLLGSEGDKEVQKEAQGVEENISDINRDHPFECVKKAYDYEGFLIDIYFEYSGRRYAVFLYSALNTSSSGYPLGESVLKARYLRKKNIKTVHLLHSIWSECRGNRIDLIYAQL